MRSLAFVLLSCGLLVSSAAADEIPVGTFWPWDPLTPAVLQQRIRAHRTAAVSLTVLGADGKPLANTAVVVRQTRHKFLFGSNGYLLDRPETAYRDRFAALFNYATLPFYWGAYEWKQGQPALERLRGMARWCAERGITVKGHPLCWQEVAPAWLTGKSYDETFKLQLERIQREVSAFAGLVDVWDVVNEAVSMPSYSGATAIPEMCLRVGQIPLLKQAFATARAADPKALLALNDYDTSAKYEGLLRDSLAAGVAIDLVGIQAHMHHAYWGGHAVWDRCERFARLGRPLHFTEVTILAGPRKEGLNYSKQYTDWEATPEGEKQQAEHVEQFYTVLFSHPALEAITWWDLSDEGAWLGAPAGLLRKDMTPRPAYEVLMKLIKGQWWTGEVRATTDAVGRVHFRGFLGSYLVETPAGTATFRLDRPGDARITGRLAAR